MAVNDENEKVVVSNSYKKNDSHQASNNTPNDIINNNNNKSEPSSLSSASKVVFTPELLKVYYSRLFPFPLMYQWLSYDPKHQPQQQQHQLQVQSKEQPEKEKQQQQQQQQQPTTAATTATITTVVTSSSSSSSSSSGKATTASSSSSSSSLFRHREFSFTLQTPMDEEIYLRYQSFKSMEDWQQAMVQKIPIKLDLGAIYSHPPVDRNSIMIPNKTFETCQRELVLDIDVSDYDEIRHCGCSGAQICTTCWHYLDMSQDVLDAALREDFGFQHIAWFYSGRRGIHAWICDERARKLSNAARSALADYLEVNLGSARNQAVHLARPLHPMLQRAHDILEPYFEKIVLPAKHGHGLLASPERWNKDVLDLLPPGAESVKENMSRRWDSATSTPQEKWAELKQHLKALSSSSTMASAKKKKKKVMESKEERALEQWPVELVLKQTYPRLDVNVTKMQNHLLKSPFCIHPKTGRVCVYMPQHPNDTSTNTKKSNNNNNKKNKKTRRMRFDPFAVPTLEQVIQELDSYHHQQDNDNESSTTTTTTTTPVGEKLKYDWQKTSLRPYFEAFETEFLQPLLKDLRKEQRQEQDKEEAQRGDF